MKPPFSRHTNSQPISRADAEAALDYMIAIEPDPTSDEPYDNHLERHSKGIDRANSILRLYGQQIVPPTLEAMREAFYGFTNSVKYRQSATSISVARASLNEAWNGINGWKI
jgi:hypothetical protein